jgi:hypothetical protein
MVGKSSWTRPSQLGAADVVFVIVVVMLSIGVKKPSQK